MKTAQWILKTEIGPLHLVASELGLRGVFWKKQPDALVRSLDSPERAVRWLTRTVEQLEEYFRGRRREFDLELDLQGTEFQKRVWQELSKIPYGKTLSYKDIAARLRKPTACRAVGTANGRNPVSIIVPCHRVITSDGKLGGYAGGLKTKTRLLEIECVKVRE